MSNLLLETYSIQGEHKVFLSLVNSSINKKGELIDTFENEYVQLLMFEDFYLNIYEKTRIFLICKPVSYDGRETFQINCKTGGD